MQINVRRKTLLERTVEALPELLRAIYESAPRRGSKAHEVLRLFVARYLWERGFKSLSFEKCISLSRDQNICVDVYVDALNLFVECERNPDRNAVIQRAEAIKKVYPTAKFVLATQDRMGWRALRLKDVADEVWVVCRDGRVLTPHEWVDERHKTLKSVFKAVELESYLNIYKEAEEEYCKFKRLSDEEEFYWRQHLNLACFKTSQFRLEWLKDLSVKGVWSRHAEAAKQRMEEAKTKIAGKVVELLNAIVSLSSPYNLKLAGDGVIAVEVDWDVWQWLGWKDYPSKSPAAASQYQMLEENMQRELKIATRSRKENVRNASVMVDQAIGQVQILEDLKKELAEMQKWVPLLLPKS